ncbi:MAG: UDP-N-acetylmuramate--alanine ligase [Armatimonadetes bacterium]|nr:UDP-N-acetylmuramate--alanine ligase [Armatimonadota bacterium]
MGGVAAACQTQGALVSGSETDLYEPMKSYLAEKGVRVLPTFDPQNLAVSEPDRIVVGNAVSRGNEELEAALDERRTITSLPQLISDRLIDRNRAAVITGTHGKTTTTAMAAWLLECGGQEPGFLIGGVPGNFTESCRPVPSHRHNKDGIFVVEGDEYDSAFFDKRSKFLWYRPTVAVINNIEFDHADIFDSVEEIKRSFALFLRLVPRSGLVLARFEDHHVQDVVRGAFSRVETFGLADECDWRAADIQVTASGSSFEIVKHGLSLGRLGMTMTGEHNVLNMLAAAAVALECGVQFAQVQQGAATFVPPKRRMEVLGEWHGATVIDDFAHHPTAIRETIKALLAKYPGRRLHIAFEPRSNTTTRNLFQKELEEAFVGASSVAIGALDRPWRYQPEERLDTDRLVGIFERSGIAAMALTIDQGKESDWGKYLSEFLAHRVEQGDVVAVFSNGNMGGLRKMLVG